MSQSTSEHAWTSLDIALPSCSLLLRSAISAYLWTVPCAELALVVAHLVEAGLQSPLFVLACIGRALCLSRQEPCPGRNSRGSVRSWGCFLTDDVRSHDHCWCTQQQILQEELRLFEPVKGPVCRWECLDLSLQALQAQPRTDDSVAHVWPALVMAQCRTRGTSARRPCTRSSTRFHVLPASPTMRT